MEHAKQATDVVAYGVTLGIFVELIPSIAGLFTIVWLAIRIYESDTVQRFIRWLDAALRGRIS